MIASIIATYTTWRVIFGVQGGMALIGLIMAFFFVPKKSELSNLQYQEKPRSHSKEDILAAFNPSHVFRLFKFPSILLAVSSSSSLIRLRGIMIDRSKDITCGLLAINQYSLLSSVRHIINPLFNLTSPMYSGLFFLAPGVGFLAGSVVAGHLSDRCVVRYRARRDGVRFAEDRLNSSLPWFFIVLPVGTLLYGWSVDQEVGGMGLPISASFIEGFGLMAAFNGLNTYAAGKFPPPFNISDNLG